MAEALFARLADALAHGHAVVLASVVAARGSTPRERAARMLIDSDTSFASVGGGALEARVLTAARRMLAEARTCEQLTMTLDGGADSVGVCGGSMMIGLRRWHGEAMARRAGEIAGLLAHGQEDTLTPDELGAPHAEPQLLRPRPRLLILGAGHCGHALAQLAAFIEFEVVVADSRPQCFEPGRYVGAHCIAADPDSLRRAAATARDLYLVLLNRDYPTDVAVLDTLAGVPYAFLGMMGSRRRIQQVRQALPQHAAWLEHIVAPVGIDIGEQTPHEIAVSILAQLIGWRAGSRQQPQVSEPQPFRSP